MFHDVYGEYEQIENQVDHKLTKLGQDPLQVIDYLLLKIKEISQQRNSEYVSYRSERRSLTPTCNHFRQTRSKRNPFDDELHELKGSRISIISRLLKSEQQMKNQILLREIQQEEQKKSSIYQNANAIQAFKIDRKELQKAFERYHLCCSLLIGHIGKIIKTPQKNIGLNRKIIEATPLEQYWKELTNEKKNCKKFDELLKFVNNNLAFSVFKEVLKSQQVWEGIQKEKQQVNQRIFLKILQNN